MGFGKLGPLTHRCTPPADEHGSGFRPIPCIGLAVRGRKVADLTPLESFYLRIGTGPSPQLPKTGERIMSKKRPAGKSPASRHVDWKALEIVHPDAAGIDVGGSEHWVAIRPERDAEPVRRFDCFTADLRAMARWLVEKCVRSVAMQSAGVDWLPVVEGVDEYG